MADGCDALVESLPAYLYGDLSDPERQAVADHLRACEACRQSLEEFQGVREALDEIPIPAMPSTGDLAARVMARARPKRVRRPAWAPLARAALILLGIGLGIAITQVLIPRPTAPTVAEMEAMIEVGGERPEIALAVENMARRTHGMPVRWIDHLQPRLKNEDLVKVTKEYRTLVHLYTGESETLAAFHQLRLGDYYATVTEDPGKARVEYLKVFDFVKDGKVHDLARARIENLLPAQPENR